MTAQDKATAIRLLDFKTVPMRAFHMAWFAFFLCFFGWFGIAPLMPIIREELHLTKEQIGNTIIASVSITIVARLIIGWLLDRYGPRRTYTALLILGSIPVMTVGLANDYTTFLLFRLAIGAIGASFVITQFHTSVMFAPNIVGTANATAAGWGNLGGGVTQMIMPVLCAVLVSWRLAMIVPGVAMLIAGIMYWFFTQDTPAGAWTPPAARNSAGTAFAEAARDRRVWALGVLYAACFGLELTIDNIAALYFVDHFHLSMGAAGVIAGTFGMMNIFARALGGIVSDRCHAKWGLNGRTTLLGITIALEGVALVCFGLATSLPLAIVFMLVTGLFIKMSNGATYSIVPFVNKRALGAVSGIVGAGGNVGAMLAGFLFKSSTIGWPQALIILGTVVTASATLALLVRFAEPARSETLVPINAEAA